MAQEIWDQITSYLPAFSAQNAADVFQFKRTDKQNAHNSLWKYIFNSEEWLQLAVEKYKVNPALLGPKLYKYYSKSKKVCYSTYMVLLVVDFSGDLRWEFAKFFQSLQKHKYDKSTYQITFDCGIVLGVRQVITGCEAIEMRDLRLLFDSRRLRTAYCFWDDKDAELRIIKRPTIVGVGGEITRLKDIAPICCLKLKLSGSPLLQQIFVEPHAPRLTPFWKDGGRYPSGEYCGWKLD